MSWKNSDKIINYLLRNPFANNSINKISHDLRISVGSAFKLLKQMESRGLVTSKSAGRALFYALNFTNPETRKLAELVLLKDGTNLNPLSMVVKRDLEKVNADAIILFGSVLSKKEPSDIDVLIVTGKKDVKKLQNSLKEVSRLHVKTISPLFLTPKDLKIGFRKQDEVVVDIIKSGKVVRGEDEIVKILGEL